MQNGREWFCFYKFVFIPIYQAYLNKYGYMDNDDMQDGMPKTDDIKQTSIEYFQLRANITMTGKEDKFGDILEV